MIEVIKHIKTVSGNNIYGFKSGNVYYSVTVDKDLNYWFALNGALSFGNTGHYSIKQHIESIGITLKENISAQVYFANKIK